MSKRTGVIANTLFGLLAQATTAIFTAGLTLYLVRALGPDGYGLFALTLSIAGIGLIVSDFGLAPSAGRFVAEEVHDPPALRRVTDAALPLKLIGAVVIAAALFLLAPLLADAYDRPALAWPVRWIALSLCFESMLMLYTSTFGAMRRVDLNARVIFFESLVEVSASVALVAVGGGVAGAVGGRAIGYATGTLVGVILLARLVGPPHPHRRVGEVGRRIASYARPLFVINGAYTLYAYTDALLIGALLTTKDLGNYSAPMKLVVMVGYVGQSIATAVAPRLAGENPDGRTFARALRALTLIQVFLVAGLVAWAQPICALALGDEFTEAPKVLRALGPYALLLGLGPLITMTVTFLGAASRRVPIVLASFALNAALNVVLLPMIGVIGAAIATGIGFAVYVPAHLRICRQALGLDLAPQARTLARALVAGALAAGVLLLVGRRDLAVWQWAVGGVAAPAVFVGALLALREVRPAELRALVRLRPS